MSRLRLQETFLTKEFGLFLLIGCLNTFDCSLLATLLTPVTGNTNVAFNLGYLLSNGIAYVLNARLVFPTALSWRGWGKFFLSYVPNYLVQNGLVAVAYNLLGVPPVVSFILAAVLGVPVTFLLVKLFAFGQREAAA